MAAQYVFRYRSFHINKSQPLGHGSYGAVYKAKCDQLPCAAKVLHPNILDPRDVGVGTILQRFEQECAFLSSIRHPHIVQYLGTTVDPESGQVILLMELLDESLTKMLECSRQMLDYHVQVDICHDISLAVTYLHSNDIIHRDLSSNNVLIMAGRRAKVTDFGISKLVGTAPTMTPLTMCPGTLAYMPPEALKEPPRYTKKLDCFSEGVIMIQVYTRLWPEPGPRTHSIPDPRSPDGTIEMPVRETERRKNHIDLIDSTHPLLPIAVECLSYEEERPSAEWICERLTNLKDWADYGNSVMRSEEAQSDAAGWQKQIKEMQVTEEKKRQYIKQQMKQLQEQSQQLKLLQQQNTQLKRENETLTTKSAQHKHSPQVTKYSTDVPLQKSTLPAHLRPQPQQPIKRKLKWRNGVNAPLDMKRGAAVVDSNVAYFVDLTQKCVCSYDSTSQKWTTLPECPFFGSCLAIVNGLLMAIGGTRSYKPTDKLFSFTDKATSGEGKKRWEEHFPAMPTARYYATAVSTGQHLVVAGGEKSKDERLDTVEIMNSDTLIWSTAASLLHPSSKASVAVCGDRLYILGGEGNSGKTQSVVTCSLTELLKSQKLAADSMWCQIANTPTYYSTCAAVDGELLAIGGLDAELDKDTMTTYQYNSVADSWHLISHMPTARSHCLVASFSSGEFMVVGGSMSSIQVIEMNIVEIATII